MIKSKKKNKVHVKKGDIVQVISGKYKSQIGEIIKVLPKASQIIIKDLNLKTKHVRPKQETESGKIISFEAPIHSSNVMLYSLKKQIRSRYRVNTNGGSAKCRQLNKTGEIY